MIYMALYDCIFPIVGCSKKGDLPTPKNRQILDAEDSSRQTVGSFPWLFNVEKTYPFRSLQYLPGWLLSHPSEKSWSESQLG
jgi:hypothetical protein